VAIATFHGPSFIIDTINKTALEIWGKTYEQVINKPVFEVSPELEDGFKTILSEIYTTGKPFITNEMPAQIKRTGKPDMAYFNSIYEPLRDLDNKIYGIISIGTEVTESVMGRKQIEASEQRFRNILSQSLMAIAIYKGPEMVVTFANESMLHVLGKGNAVLNKPLLEGVPELKDQVFPKLLADVYTKGMPFEGFETKTILVRNEIPVNAYFNFVYQPYREIDDTITGITVLATEVTEQVLAKKQIEESEKQFRIFADSIQNLAWIANGEGWIYWYNQQWYDYTGTTLEEMQGWGWAKVHHPDHIEKVVAFAKEVWKKDEAFEQTFPLRRHDGEYRWFLTRAFPVKDVNGNIERWIGTNTDITMQKTFTEELETKVKERTEELQEKNAALELANAELASFSSIASHDLKEPLRKIQSFGKLIIETIETENVSDKTLDYFNRIISAAERMQNLINSLLEFSYINSTEKIFEPCDLNTLVVESENDLLISISEKAAIIEHENLPVIMGVYIQISQLITNLLSNAVKYSRPGIKPLIKITSSIMEGNIIEHFSANKQMKYHAIKFADNGIGFEQKYANKIFELFQRLHGKNQYSGTGIGLGIVKKIVTNHDGFIIAEGKPGIGSTFTIYIPAT
jgi:PAS domain S-box-containing protein